MTKKKFLDSVDVKSPCNESWDEMFGNDEVRFCSHCAKNVHNLSAMTKKKAEELVKKSEGKLCVRYIKTPEGKLITASPTLTKITRRATIAASVLATSLTLSTMAYSQGEPIKPKDNSTQTQKDILKKDNEKQDLATNSGTVMDELNAVISQATVILLDVKSGKILKTQTNDEGIYEFKNVEIGIYQIESFANGFATTNLKDVEVKQSSFKKDIMLQVGELIGEVIFIEVSTSITGVIKDRNDAVIPNAKITLRGTKTGKTLETKSHSDGSYDLIDFEPGVYELTIESTGFKKALMQNIEVLKDAKLQKDFVLEVGGVLICELTVEPPSKKSEAKNKSIINKKTKSSKPKKKKN